jgi:hypothetical protein
MRLLPVQILTVVCLALFACAGSSSSDGWISLYDGATFDGWKASENTETFSIQDGVIVVSGNRSHLFYTGPVQNHDFQNFEFKADVLTMPQANSGIFIHTEYQEEGWPSKGYELQVNNSYTGNPKSPEQKVTGSLYGVRNVFTRYVPDETWFEYYIKVEGRSITVKIDGVTVMEYIEPEQPVRREGQETVRLSRGTFAIQGHDPGSTMKFKNIYVRPLPDAPMPPDTRSAAEIAYQLRVEKFQINAFPLIDLHVHLKSGWDIETALQQARINGINYGIAVNCGIGHTVENDEGARKFFQSLAGLPVFRAMQAEGREWVDMFSDEVHEEFDYVFTDAMTFHDKQGRRMRLWVKETVFIDDPQDFMEMYVVQIEKIINNEPIDIYVNATVLPEVIRDDYDALWTPERMDRVIAALVKNNVPMEISARYKIPSIAFVQRAKDAGVKFTFGTNNTNKDIGRLEYCMDVAETVGLDRKDMFVPGY